MRIASERIIEMKTRLLALASIPLSLAAIAGATSLLGTQGATPFADTSPSTSGVWHHYQAQETYIDDNGERIKNTKEYYVECGSGVHQFEAPVSPKQLIEETKHPDVSEFAVNDVRYGDTVCTAGIKYTESGDHYVASIVNDYTSEKYLTDQVLAAYNHGKPVTHVEGFENKSITSLLLPSTVTDIATGAFHDCTLLTSFTIPSTVTYVGASVFLDCTSLETLNYYSSYDIQGDLCNGCSSLTTVHIRGEVRNIGANAFAGTDLKNIYYSGSEASWKSITKGDNWCGGLTPTIHFNYVA